MTARRVAFVALVAAMVAVVAVLAVRGWRTPGFPAVEVHAPPPNKAPVAMPAKAASPVVRAAPAAPPASAAALPPGWIEVCRTSPQRLEDWNKRMEAEGLPAQMAAIKSSLAPLALHPDARLRAGGLVLTMQLASSELAAIDKPSPDCKTADCAMGRFTEALLKARERPLSQLVRLALDSRDVAVYALAVQACQVPPLPADSGPCRQVSPAEWARREPDNRQAWWWVATQAAADRDMAARDEALHRVLSATRNDNHFDSMVQALIAAVPEHAPAELQASGMMFGTSVWMAMATMTGSSVALAACSANAVADANVWQRCERLSKLLLDQPLSAVDAVVARGLAKRLGLPHGRADELYRQFLVANRVKMERVFPESDPASCRSLGAFRHWLADLGRLGEIGADAGMVQRSGLDAAVLERMEREVDAQMKRAQAMASVAEAARAASAAASR